MDKEIISKLESSNDFEKEKKPFETPTVESQNPLEIVSKGYTDESSDLDW